MRSGLYWRSARNEFTFLHRAPRVIGCRASPRMRRMRSPSTSAITPQASEQSSGHAVLTVRIMRGAPAPCGARGERSGACSRQVDPSRPRASLRACSCRPSSHTASLLATSRPAILDKADRRMRVFVAQTAGVGNWTQSRITPWRWPPNRNWPGGRQSVVRRKDADDGPPRIADSAKLEVDIQALAAGVRCSSGEHLAVVLGDAAAQGAMKSCPVSVPQALGNDHVEARSDGLGGRMAKQRLGGGVPTRIMPAASQ